MRPAARCERAGHFDELADVRLKAVGARPGDSAGSVRTSSCTRQRKVGQADVSGPLLRCPSGEADARRQDRALPEDVDAVPAVPAAT
jgi:hypothetical protein